MHTEINTIAKQRASRGIVGNMSQILVRLLGAAVLFTTSLACAGAEPVVENKLAVAGGVITSGDCEAFGRQLAEDFNAGNFEAFFGRLNTAAFTKLVFEGFELSEKERLEHEQRITKSVVEGLTEKFQQFKKAKYLRTQEVEGEKRVLLRLTAENFAITYVAFFVERNEAGNVCWTDAFGYATAESISDGLRRFLLFVTQGKLTHPRNLAEAAIYSNGRQFVQKLTRMQKLFEKGEYNSAVRMFDQLPDELRTAKFVLSQRVQAAQKLGEEAYIKAIEAWEEAYAGDPSLNLIAIDGHLLRKNYPDVVRCITALENQLKGTDGRLCFIKAYALEQDHQAESARVAAVAGVKTEPDMSENYTVLMKLSLDEGDFPAAVRILQSIEKNMPDEDPKRMIPKARDTDAFLKSDELRAWMKARL